MKPAPEQTVKTAEDGSFTISFVPQKEDNDEGNNYFPSAYLFTVKATVTDLNGETQSEEYTIHVADVSMIPGHRFGCKIQQGKQRPNSCEGYEFGWQ